MNRVFENFNLEIPFVRKLEDIASDVVIRSRVFLPTIARICLVSTFFEDGVRLVTQFTEQCSYISNIWNQYYFLATIFIIINIAIQLSGSFLVVFRYKVELGVYLLMASILIQTIGYHIWSRIFILRNLALCGSLALLLAESKTEQNNALPSTGEKKSNQFILLGGRILVILMFFTVIHLDSGVFYIIQALLNLFLIGAVAVGYKTKLSCLILIVWLSIINFVYNGFWSSYSDSVMWDFLKYDFFQTWTIVGGLILIVSYGPGGVSIDNYKKNW
uniref:Surfeit locus protein 4 n=1 Tax=Lepeophtheirus salmonis TaxID=72036 RepID=D3PIE5_LEPSM|nr:Surfeit locus protein 4 [Lepeophtheirus salmonis]